MVANGTRDTFKQRWRRQLANSQVDIGLFSRLEIESGCVLHIFQQVFDTKIHTEEDRTFWCRVIILHVSRISGMDDKLLAGLRNNFTSIIVLCYKETNSRPSLSKDTMVCIDMHLNWLSKHLIENEVPKTSLLAEILGGSEVTHIDKQMSVSQSATLDLVDHVKNNNEVAKCFLLKYYFYRLMVQCVNRMLLDRSRLLSNDDLDFLTKENKIDKAVTRLDHSLQRKFPGVGELAFISGMSVSSFLGKFHAIYNETPFEYFRKRQMDLAVALLKKGLSIKYISYNLGYQDPANFSRAFKNFYGMSPKQYDIDAE